MQLCRVSFESHPSASTIYVTGLLGEAAAIRAEELIRALPTEVFSLRVDLRAVDLVDPNSFVRLARMLGRWRDARSGRVTLEFPARSMIGREPNLLLVDQPNRIGNPVSSAMTWPMSTSPGS